MLIAIDVGNTNMVFGIFEGENLIGSFRLMTDVNRTSDEIGLSAYEYFHRFGWSADQVEDVIIASVVPSVMYSLTSAMVKYFGRTPLVVDVDIDPALPYVESDSDEHLGADRSVACVAAMAKAARDNVGLSLAQFTEFSQERSDDINDCEEKLDRFADNADNYLIELSRSIETQKDKHQLNMLMQCVPNLERIGDYATNFNEMAQELSESEYSFSPAAQEELRILGDAVMEIIRLTMEALQNDSFSTACRIEPLEEVIDDMVLLLKDRHTARLCQGVCSINAGLIFMDALTYLERAADQCSSIAMLILSKDNEAIMKNHHHYLQVLHSSGDQSYLAEQENRRQQYLAPLEHIQY